MARLKIPKQIADNIKNKIKKGETAKIINHPVNPSLKICSNCHAIVKKLNARFYKQCECVFTNKI